MPDGHCILNLTDEHGPLTRKRQLRCTSGC